MTYIFGAGGNARSIASIMIEMNLKISGFVVDEPLVESIMETKVIGFSEFLKLTGEISCVLSIGHNSMRKSVYDRLTSGALGQLTFPTLIHPTSYVAKTSSIERGAVVYPHAVVGPESIVSEFVHLNTQSIVEHESKVSNFSSLAPGAIVGGNSNIGIESAILMNATVSNGTGIGNFVVVGANSFVKTSTGDNELWVGNPAAMKKQRDKYDDYLKVNLQS